MMVLISVWNRVGKVSIGNPRLTPSITPWMPEPVPLLNLEPISDPFSITRWEWRDYFALFVSVGNASTERLANVESSGRLSVGMLSKTPSKSTLCGQVVRKAAPWGSLSGDDKHPIWPPSWYECLWVKCQGDISKWHPVCCWGFH